MPFAADTERPRSGHRHDKMAQNEPIPRDAPHARGKMLAVCEVLSLPGRPSFILAKQAATMRRWSWVRCRRLRVQARGARSRGRPEGVLGPSGVVNSNAGGSDRAISVVGGLQKLG